MRYRYFSEKPDHRTNVYRLFYFKYTYEFECNAIYLNNIEFFNVVIKMKISKYLVKNNSTVIEQFL